MSNESGGKSYGNGVKPWDLCEDMQSSGNAHVDALRADVIEYAFRKKGDVDKMIDDLEKAAHCATRAAEVLRKRKVEEPELPFAESLPPVPKEPIFYPFKCLDCGKPTLPDKPYCATCILEPGPR
jgi:hypothetical protein